MAVKKNGPKKKTAKKASTSSTKGKGRGKVEKVMHEYKEGTLKSSSGARVKKPKQAIAIALSEARAAGAKIPRKKPAPKKKAVKKKAVPNKTAKKTARRSKR